MSAWEIIERVELLLNLKKFKLFLKIYFNKKISRSVSDTKTRNESSNLFIKNLGETGVSWYCNRVKLIAFCMTLSTFILFYFFILLPCGYKNSFFFATEKFNVSTMGFRGKFFGIFRKIPPFYILFGRSK